MFIPAFFTEEGHHLTALLADIIGIPMVFIGYLIGQNIKRITFKNRTINLKDENADSLLIAFVVIIYGVRLSLFLDVGIYAFLHPFSRESSLIDTLGQQLTWPYIILLMTMFYLTRRSIYMVLIIGEIIMFIIPTMARSYYLNIFLYYMMIMYFYGKVNLVTLVKRFTPLYIVIIIFIALVGPFINSVRSYAAIGEYKKGLALEFNFEANKAKFLIDRLNVHGESFNFEPIVNEAVRLDQIALQSMAKRWLGFSSDYEIHPTSVSNYAGRLVGHGMRTSTDVPRNYILINYELGVFAVLGFNLGFGMLLGAVYKILFKLGNRLFVVMWVPFVMAPAFGSQGAFTSTFIFQYIFVIASFVVLFVMFILVKLLRSSLK
jgi:hypothetical protein